MSLTSSETKFIKDLKKRTVLIYIRKSKSKEVSTISVTPEERAKLQKIVDFYAIPISDLFQKIPE